MTSSPGHARGLERLLEEMVFELNLSIGIGICQMAKEVKDVPDGGITIDKGTEVRETWCVPEASSLFQEALSTGHSGCCQRQDQVGVKQDQSREALKSPGVPSQELELYPLGNGEPLKCSRTNTIIFMY